MADVLDPAVAIDLRFLRIVFMDGSQVGDARVSRNGRRWLRFVLSGLAVVGLGAAALVAFAYVDHVRPEPPSRPRFDPGAQGDAGRVILVVLDGVRWQDFFDVPGDRLRDDDAPAPFAGFWRELAETGAVYGDRTVGSRVRMTLRGPLARRLSTPSYQAMLAGYAQSCADNECGRIQVETLPEALLRRRGLPREQVPIVVTCPCVTLSATHDTKSLYIDDGVLMKRGELQRLGLDDHWEQRPDAATMEIALDVLRERRPPFLLIQLDDTDGRAHEGDLDAYLSAMRSMDDFLLRLFATLDEMGPGERERTTVLVTTDHGRGGAFAGRWKTHGEAFGAQDVFLAAIGPHVEPVGKVTSPHEEIRHADLRPTIELLLGLEPEPCSDPTCGWPIAALLAGGGPGEGGGR